MRWVCRYCDFWHPALTRVELHSSTGMWHGCPNRRKANVNLVLVDDSEANDE